MKLRRNFSAAARREFEENGHIENMARGFRDALQHVTGNLKTDI